MTIQAHRLATRSHAWRALAGAGCGLAAVLVYELVCWILGLRGASHADVPILGAVVGGLLWGLAGGLGAGAAVAVYGLLALAGLGRTGGLEGPLVVAAALALPVAAGALAGAIRDRLGRAHERMLAIVEARLQSSEDRFRALVANLPEGVVTCAGGTIEYVNPAFVHMAGGPHAAAFIGRPLSDFFQLDDGSSNTAPAVLQSGALKAADGTLRQVETTWFPVDEGGRAVVHGVLRNVSERVSREAATRASEARFRSLSELSSDWYWEQDEEFRFVVAGADSNGRPGERSAALIGKKRWDDPTATPSEEQWRAHRAVLEAHQPFQDFEYGRIDLDGRRRWVSVNGAPLFDDSGRFTGYRGAGRDITARKQADLLRDLEHTVAHSLAGAADTSIALTEVIRAVCETQQWAWGQFWRIEANRVETIPVETDRIESIDCTLRAVEHWAQPDSAAKVQLAAESDTDTGGGLPFHVLRSGEPLWVADVLEDARVSQPSFAFDAGRHGAFLFPVVFEGRTIGVLSFSSPEIREPDERLLAAVRVVGSQVGQFLRRKQAEEELRRFRIALDNSADMILLIDRSSMRYVDVNDTVCRLLGYTREEMISMGPQDVLPASRASLEQAYDLLIAQPELSGSLRSYYRCKDGSALPFESSRHVIRSGDGYLIAAISRDIRARLAAEEVLRESEARFRSLVELSSDWFWEQDENYRFLPLANASIGKDELRPPEFVGKTPWEASPEALSEAEWDAFRARLERREAFHDMEYRRRSRDGEWRWVSISGEPIHDADGRFRGYRGIGRDITERKQAEIEQAEQLQFITEVIDAIPQPVYFKDLEGRYVGLNRAFEKMYGVRRAELFGKTARYLSPAVDADLHEAQDSKALGLSGVVEYEADVRAADGTLRRTLQHKTIYRHADGSARGTLGVITDITDRVVAARALAESEAGFRAIFERSNAGITLWTADGRFLAVNEAQARFLGYTREEMLGLKVEAVRSNADPDWDSQLKKLLSGEADSYTRDRLYLRKDGREVWGRLSVAPVRDADGQIQYFVSISTDITEAREASGRIERLNAELESRVRERTAELEALVRELESFSYTISHDLRAPLRAMSGFAEILLQGQGEGLSAEGMRMLTRIRSNARRMSELLDGLLAFSRLGRRSIARTATPMRELAERGWAELAGQREGRRVDFEIGDLPACEGDPMLLEQVWANLLSNAVKYTRDRDPARIAVGWDERNQAYFVRDNGAGFDMQYYDKLFGVFSRLHGDSEFEGTGLGLAICERILRRHGGHIRAEAKPNEGATFYFSV